MTRCILSPFERRCPKSSRNLLFSDGTNPNVLFSIVGKGKGASFTLSFTHLTLYAGTRTFEVYRRAPSDARMYDDDRFSFLWLRECCGFEAGSNRRGFLLRSIVNEINILAPAAKTAAAAATRWSVEASMRYGLFLFSLNRSLSLRPLRPSLKV